MENFIFCAVKNIRIRETDMLKKYFLDEWQELFCMHQMPLTYKFSYNTKLQISQKW